MIRTKNIDLQELIRNGAICLDKSDYKGARSQFRLALMYNPRLASMVAMKYEDILEMDPDNVNARLSLADMHLYLGELEGAIGELEELLDVMPDRSDIYNMLGKLYLKQGDTDSVISVLEVAFRSGMKDISLTEMLAGAYMEKGRIDEAIELYKTLIVIDPKSKNYFRILGELEVRLDKLSDAASSFYSMIDADPSSVTEVIYKLEEVQEKAQSNVYIKEKLCDAYIKAIKPAAAVSELEQILNIDPTRIDRVISKYREMLNIYPDEPATLKSLAKTLTTKGSYSEAVVEYRKLIRFSDQFIDDAIAGFKDILVKFPGQVHAHESLGDAYIRLGRIEEAMQEYFEVLSLNAQAAGSVIEKCLKYSKESPNTILIRQVLGQAYLLAGDVTRAIEEAEFMIYLNKNYTPAHQILGDAYYKTGNFLKARDCYAEAMENEPYNIALHIKYAQVCTSITEDDIRALRKRIDDDPWRLGTHLDIAKLYLMTGDFDKGIRELQMAIKDTSRAPFAHNLLGITFVEMGRFDLAVIQFERAMEIVPRELSDLSKAVRFNCGGAYEAIGNIPAAIGQYEVLLSEDVDYKGVQERVKNLASINPDALRNKLIAAVLEDLGETSLIGMWGQDKRHNEINSETLNMSFGQEHNSAGFEHFIKGRFKGAIEEFSLAVQLDPKFCAALNNMAVMLMKEGSMEQAETRLNLALSLDPDSAVVHSNMGILYMVKKDHKAAMLELSKAIELDPGLSAAYLNLGDANYLDGMAQEAISMWSKIRSHDPLSPIAIRRLAYKTLNA